MDKKEKKRDISTFANMLKELMNDPYDDILTTLDRDIQHFIYGRVATLVKHNEGKPIGSVADISTVVGAAYADVLKEFTRGVTDEKLNEVVQTAKLNLLRGFDARCPKYEITEEELAEMAREEGIVEENQE